MVEWRDHDNKLVIRTGLQTQKAILSGYHYPTYLSEYTQKIGRYGEELSFIRLDRTVCKETVVDVITKEHLLNAFKETLNSEGFVDGKVDLDNIGDLIASHRNSPFVGEEIPEDVREARFDVLSTLLSDEEQLNETFGFISSTITGLLEKYQDSEQYSKLVQELADSSDFMAKIQRFQIIRDRIEKKQEELDC